MHLRGTHLTYGEEISEEHRAVPPKKRGAGRCQGQVRTRDLSWLGGRESRDRTKRKREKEGIERRRRSRRRQRSLRGCGVAALEAARFAATSTALARRFSRRNRGCRQDDALHPEEECAKKAVEHRSHGVSLLFHRAISTECLVQQETLQQSWRVSC